jgi:endo-1,4-beta-mannosidase
MNKVQEIQEINLPKSTITIRLYDNSILVKKVEFLNLIFDPNFKYTIENIKIPVNIFLSCQFENIHYYGIFIHEADTLKPYLIKAIDVIKIDINFNKNIT